jgi:L-ascorbate metabolism protein UlaG (beta-lactamase superfamily)
MLNLMMEFRWLGVAGIELRVEDCVLVIDPFFTRPPFRRLWLGRVRPDQGLIAGKIKQCDFILVSHAHYDHLMDVPEVMRNTGATALGSENACRLLALLGAPAEHIRPIRAGDQFPLGMYRPYAGQDLQLSLTA